MMCQSPTLALHWRNNFTLTIGSETPRERERERERGNAGIRSPVAVVVGRGPPQLLTHHLWAEASDGEPGVTASQVERSSLPMTFESVNAKIQRPRA
jgi:hypothetical protein